MDEYDWILFEGALEELYKTLQFYKKAYKLVGLTGSTLTLKEECTLEMGLGATIVNFPEISTLTVDKKVHLVDHIVNTT